MRARSSQKPIKRAANRQSGRWKSSLRRRYLIIAGTTTVALAAGLTLGFRMPLYPAWVIALSVVLFITYGFDKHQAKVSGGRVPEFVLHILAFAGGFPGGWLGRGWFRHKTLKQSFLIVLIVSTMLHGALALRIYAL